MNLGIVTSHAATLQHQQQAMQCRNHLTTHLLCCLSVLSVCLVCLSVCFPPRSCFSRYNVCAQRPMPPAQQAVQQVAAGTAVMQQPVCWRRRHRWRHRTLSAAARCQGSRVLMSAPPAP